MAYRWQLPQVASQEMATLFQEHAPIKIADFEQFCVWHGT